MSRLVRQTFNWMRAGRGFLPLLIFLGFWQLTGGSKPNFPPPFDWWRAVSSQFEKGALVPAFQASLRTMLLGLIGACLIGTVIGLSIGLNARLRRWSALTLEFMRALPPPVIVPVAVMFAGYTTSMEITVVAIAASWPILLNVVAGVDRLSTRLDDVATVFQLGWADRLVRIVLPQVFPWFLSGLRVAIPLAIVLTLLVEMLTGLPGLGVIMIQGQRNFNSSQVFGMLAVVAVLGFGAHILYSLCTFYLLGHRAGQS
jgi:ABC-type nitrate/sulfonate/bicarbonate transport system permease component